ncbi:hypothetical protein [Mycobacteroides abscessus]|uniref:hypothetical protein n=1 Tax=Mycobacteroides abscessus TaxID=36809 RepID=UPI00092A8816|nr:hypothetical protein [Mycobacteroides abscessus]SHT88754.1 Uncharacterised protein [Mycobacteroides abscessus subsp. bolletii]SHX39078.1 Uncharacterised protein [Mycobacteroides abscessus subsp. bolletii]SHX44550.1 Uncharacterised protein [Mycobacteroides abscessus subsp. bolletii]SHX89620.1 Uncharacterised protein [Mycobacteroides abscessus subsp. bolletii]SKS43391.1 Uncharacterised protein [Mycobacteroides abscessus subsp. bolletii]
MITPIEPECVLSDRIFGDALGVVQRSDAAALIDSYAAQARGVGGRPRTGSIRYTMTAVLVALLARIMLTRTPSIRGVLATIADFTDTQRAAVGMVGAAPMLIRADYKRFHDWLTTQLASLDSHHDLPARRVRNDHDRCQRAARTAEVLAQQAAALERSRIVTNRIIAGSILDPVPPKCRGDVVADGTILDLSGPTNLGVRANRMRGAAPMGRFYARTSANTVHTGQGSPGQLRKAGYGIEITAITRIGQPDALHAVAPVITGIDIHTPTSGSVEGLGVALRFHQENGFDNRVGGRARWPRLVIDMGYNTKTGFGELMLDRKYAAVARYPKHWSKLHIARNPEGATNSPPPGVIQGYGALYCEAATPLLTVDNLLKPTRDLLTARAFRAHDERLAALLPLLVGLNSKPRYSRPTRGRPRNDQSRSQHVVKLEIVCPAVQLRVRCPLKPDSMRLASMDAPTVHPTWAAQERTLCRKSSTTLTLTDDQLRMAQFDLVPISWEHALYFEAARALTEQRFGFLKNPHITGVSDLIWGPKREPILKIIIACAIAVANLRSQQAPADRLDRTESIQIKWRRLAHDLGREPTRTPPRT